MRKKLAAIIVLVIVALLSMISIYAYAETASDDDLTLKKTVTQEVDENGNYQIDLEAYTTGKVETASVPLDVIFVLDTSGTMNYYFDSEEYGREKKSDCLKRSVNDFLTNLNQNAEDNDLTHRVSVVTFAYTAKKVTGNNYMEITGGNSVDGVIDLVNGIKSSGATHTDEGMKAAKEIYKTLDSSEKEGRSQVVILFTDGAPDYSEIEEEDENGIDVPVGYSTEVPDNAIRDAKYLKDSGVTVYSVGVLPGAKVDEITFADETKTEGPYEDNVDVLANRFLNYLCSNSSNAKNLGVEIPFRKEKDKKGNTINVPYIEINQSYEWSNKGYYKIADDADELFAIFNTMSYNLVTSSISLDDKTQVKDYISDYFMLPADFSGEDICLEIIPYSGGSSWGAAVPFTYVNTENGIAEYQSSAKDYSLYAKWEKDVGSVVVYGYDFDENVVVIDEADNATGNKLHISFPITRKENFIGGNDIPTNLSTSGVYSDDEFIKKFEEPNTQVELIYDYESKDQIIYRGNPVEFDEILKIGTDNLGMGNKFVEIKYVVYDSEGQEIGTIIIPKESSEVSIPNSLKNRMEDKDTRYRIECTVTPNPADEESVAEYNEEKGAAIYVLQPDVYGRNLWVDYGTEVNLKEHATSKLTWSGNEPEGVYHSNKEKPPTVVVSYVTYDSEGATEEVEANEITVTNNLKYKIDKLNMVSSVSQSEIEVDVKSDIYIYLNEYIIEVTKQVNKDEFLKNPQSFLFHIKQKDTMVELMMPSEAFEEKDDDTLFCTMKVSGLYAGLDSVVSEIPEWSWRYELDNSNKNVTVTHHNEPKISYIEVDDGETDAQFQNKCIIENWLSDEQVVINKFAEN